MTQKTEIAVFKVAKLTTTKNADRINPIGIWSAHIKKNKNPTTK
jgi:hypothetical protein